MSPRVLRVFLSSTSEDLVPYRTAAGEEIAGQGWFADMMEHFKAGPERTIDACQERVRTADLVVLLVAFRRGWVPSPEEGGDGKRSIVAFELEAAERNKIPVLVLMASESWPGNFWEPGDEGRAWMKDFRARFNRFASFFDVEQPAQDPRFSLPVFRSKVRDVLVANREKLLNAGTLPPAPNSPELTIVFPPSPGPLPERPYPLLEPYTHPATFAGREDDLAELKLTLRQRQSLVCLYAPSGAGKSSLLQAGLLPQLGTDRIPATLDLHPDEPGLARRLLAGVANLQKVPAGDEDWPAFADAVAQVRQATAAPPVFILDQFETVFRPDRRKEVLVRLGPLLASTFQRVPGIDGAMCRWILAYRQDFHGEVMTWLEDVLADARTGGKPADLPYDLRSPDRCQSWAMRVLGQPRPGGDVVAAATRAFTAAIEKPLALVGANGHPQFKWQFAAGDATRLAQSFAEQRQTNPESPLTPQLQVVLARLLAEATAEPDGVLRMQVPAEPGTLIRDALDAHLRRGLEDAFPATRDGQGRTSRTRALLALRELCDASGRRAQDVPESTLKAALGENGEQIIEKLTAPAVRLVVPQVHSDGTIWYSLPHDSLAELISRLFQEDQRLAEYSLDRKLVELWRLVTQKSEYYTRTGDASALELSNSQARAVKQHESALLWDTSRQQWWKEVSKLRAKRARRSAAAFLAFAAVLLLAAGGAYWLFDRNRSDEVNHDIDFVMSADYGQVLLALSDAVNRGFGPKEIVELLRKRTRKDAITALIDGPRRLPENVRLRVLVPVVRSVLEDYVNDPTGAGAMLAALDHYGLGDISGMGAEAQELRERIVMQMQKTHPPPAFRPDDWVPVSVPVDLAKKSYRGKPYMDPLGEPNFRISRRDVTGGEYLQLDPAYKSALSSDYPAVVNWMQAYAYAAWRGARLPTGLQWEATCRAAFPSARLADALPEPPDPFLPEDDLAKVVWFRENAFGELHPVARLQPDRLGLYDLLGNVWEWGDQWTESTQNKSQDGTAFTVLFGLLAGGNYRYSATQFACQANMYSDLLGAHDTGIRLVMPTDAPK